MKSHPEASMLIITHYSMILDYLKPDYIHILSDKHIIKTGDAELVKAIEKDGFQPFIGGNASV